MRGEGGGKGKKKKDAAPSGLLRKKIDSFGWPGLRKGKRSTRHRHVGEKKRGGEGLRPIALETHITTLGREKNSTNSGDTWPRIGRGKENGILLKKKEPPWDCGIKGGGMAALLQRGRKKRGKKLLFRWGGLITCSQKGGDPESREGGKREKNALHSWKEKRARFRGAPRKRGLPTFLRRERGKEMAPSATFGGRRFTSSYTKGKRGAAGS